MEYKIEKEVVYKVAGRYYKSEEEAKKAVEYREITQKNEEFKTLIRMTNSGILTSNKLIGCLN